MTDLTDKTPKLSVVSKDIPGLKKELERTISRMFTDIVTAINSKLDSNKIAASTNNKVARYHETDGIQGSSASIDNSGNLTISISVASSDLDKFLVSDGGVIKYRTGDQVLSDLGNVCRIKTGTYTGDGTTGQAVTGVGFRPKYLRIWEHSHFTGEVDAYVLEKLDQSWGDYAFLHFYTALHEHRTLDNRVNSLDADGFTVDDDDGNFGPNENGVVYDYLALG